MLTAIAYPKLAASTPETTVQPRFHLRFGYRIRERTRIDSEATRKLPYPR